MRASLVVAWGLLAVALVACSAKGPVTTATTLAGPHATPTAAAASPSLTAVLPEALAPLAASPNGQTLTETESCAGCHAQAAAEWRASPHAFASFDNPVYRVAVDRFRRDVGRDASRFCGRCHDVALLADGAMASEVAPNDPRAHVGVACRTCHGIETTALDGNGSYTLTDSPIPIPRDGDDASLREHKARMALAPLRTAAMCGTCHRSFLSTETGNPSHLTGQDEIGAWQRSAYAGSHASRIDPDVKAAECRTCHMPLVDAPLGDAAAKDGKIHSHRFPGGNTWLASMRGDKDQLQAVRAMLQGAASIDIAVARAADWTRTLPADGAPLHPGQPVLLDVVVRNERAGHRFPGGVLDAQDTWIEVEIHDATGRLLAEAGTKQESTGQDPSAHVLRALQADAHGTPALVRDTQDFRAPVFDHTIAPRDAEVERYLFDVPADLRGNQLPLRATARLRHRSRDRALFKAVCDESKTPRAIAFERQVYARADTHLDACAPEPVTEIAARDVFLGEGATPSASGTPTWQRLYDDGLGLLHAQQEEIDAARPALERALELAPDRAMVLQALAEMAVREGRTDEALARLDEAEALAPGEPSIAHARAEALSGVWRWREAAAPLAQTAEAVPLDDSVWAHLAVAYGAAGEPADALAAAQRGLALAPRNADMLRVQALALETLGAPLEVTQAARDAFARWRPPDDAPAVKSACSSQFGWCALERIPVHVHPLRPVSLH